MSERWAGGSTRAWRKVRAAVLGAPGGSRCKLRIVGVCTTRATHVHHTQPREIVGDDPRYLVSACAACNLHVGDPTKVDPPAAPRRWWDQPA